MIQSLDQAAHVALMLERHNIIVRGKNYSCGCLASVHLMPRTRRLMNAEVGYVGEEMRFVDQRRPMKILVPLFLI